MMRAWTALAPALLAMRAFSQPATLSGFSHQGKFLLYLNEDQPGRVTFQWKPDGRFESSFTFTMPGDSWRSSLSLTPDAEGQWIRSEYAGGRHKTSIERECNELIIHAPAKNGTGRMPPGMLVFEESSPALISQALRQYDASKGGKQTFGLLELSKVDGGALTLERQDTAERSVGGRALKVTHWIYARPAFELHVVAGEDGRVYLVSGVPWFTELGDSEQRAMYVREGYQSLRPQPADDPLISQPKYEVRMETVMMPMRDGVKLVHTTMPCDGRFAGKIILAGFFNEDWGM